MNKKIGIKFNIFDPDESESNRLREVGHFSLSEDNSLAFIEGGVLKCEFGGLDDNKINIFNIDTPTQETEEVGLDAVLDERDKRYGSFSGHATLTQELKCIMRTSSNWVKLKDDQTEALEMIAHKIGRILNGDPDYADSWVDIAGYAKLVGDRLEREQ